VLGALHLQLLEHQALEHLLAQHVLGRQFLLGFLEALGNGGDLLIELALEHDALHARLARHRGGHAIEQVTGGRELARLGMRDGGQEERWHERDKKPLHCKIPMRNQRFVSGRS
jgi:hypothetical protein